MIEDVSRLLFDKVRKQTGNSSYWQYRTSRQCGMAITRIHVAVVKQPILNRMLTGEKKIEVRLSQNRATPWMKVKNNDIILIVSSYARRGELKGVRAVCDVQFVSYTEIKSRKDFHRLKATYANMNIPQEKKYWSQKASAKYATVIGIDNLYVINPAIPMVKDDRRAWITEYPYLVWKTPRDHRVPLDGPSFVES